MKKISKTLIGSMVLLGSMAETHAADNNKPQGAQKHQEAAAQQTDTKKHKAQKKTKAQKKNEAPRTTEAPINDAKKKKKGKFLTKFSEAKKIFGFGSDKDKAKQLTSPNVTPLFSPSSSLTGENTGNPGNFAMDLPIATVFNTDSKPEPEVIETYSDVWIQHPFISSTPLGQEDVNAIKESDSLPRNSQSSPIYDSVSLYGNPDKDHSQVIDGNVNSSDAGARSLAGQEVITHTEVHPDMLKHSFSISNSDHNIHSNLKSNQSVFENQDEDYSKVLNGGVNFSEDGAQALAAQEIITGADVYPKSLKRSDSMPDISIGKNVNFERSYSANDVGLNSPDDYYFSSLSYPVNSTLDNEEPMVLMNYTGASRSAFGSMDGTDGDVDGSVIADEFVIPDGSVIADEFAIPHESVTADEFAIPDGSVIADEFAIPDESVIADEFAIPDESVIADEFAIPDESVIADEFAIPDGSVIADEFAIPDGSVIADEFAIPDESTSGTDVIRIADSGESSDPDDDDSDKTLAPASGLKDLAGGTAVSPLPSLPPRPETGIYAANMASANTLFASRSRDRIGAAHYHSDVNNGDDPIQPSLWMHVAGGQNKARLQNGAISTRTNSQKVMLGGDIFNQSLNNVDGLHVGVLFGAGKTSSHSQATEGNSAKGGVSGQTVGIYSTWYSNDENQEGPYLDGQLNYGWFDNSLDVKATDAEAAFKDEYRSRGFVGSLEAGYTWKLFNHGTYNTYLQPQMQVTWMGVNAKDHLNKQGATVSMLGANNVQIRLGSRLYMSGCAGADIGKQRVFQPYIELNAIHNTKDFGVKLDNAQYRLQGAKHIGEAKIGIDGQINQSLSIWGGIGQQVGASGYHDTQGTLGVKVNF